MSKPKVLVFIDWYKPYFKAGGPVRSLVNLVDHLGARVDLHIVTGDRDYIATSNEAGVPSDRWTKADAAEQVWYASPGGRSMQVWRSILNEQAWDVVYINGIYSRWSNIVPLWLLRGSAQRRIVAVRGMLAAGPMRQGALKKRLFLAVMKALGCFKGVEFQATNTDEVADIRRWIGPDVKVHLVQNLARKVTSTAPPTIVKVPGKLKLVSLARIAEEKNTLFAIQRLAEIQGKVRFDLYGTVYDEAYFARCKTAIGDLPEGIEVVWHGQLPNEEGVRVLTDSHALFMPSVGENFGHTMLEALSVGRPLVISDRTPWKQLEASGAGWDLPLEDPVRFTDALQQLVDMDQSAYDRLIKGAYMLGSRYLNDPVPVELTFAMFNR
ncbi:MAG: glycosyltransferase [Flavobacteriales bacterium]|nr:glycosyltransferase [Flavobacteriales bacterium]